MTWDMVEYDKRMSRWRELVKAHEEWCEAEFPSLRAEILEWGLADSLKRREAKITRIYDQ